MEELLREALVVGDRARLLEVVHVELAHEARKVAMLEVLGQDPVTEFVYIAYDKTGAILIPRHYVIIAWVADEFVRLGEEHRQVGREALLRIDNLNYPIRAFFNVLVLLVVSMSATC